MLRKILPRHPVSRLYVGVFAIGACISGTIVLTEAVGHRVFGR